MRVCIIVNVSGNKTIQDTSSFNAWRCYVFTWHNWEPFQIICGFTPPKKVYDDSLLRTTCQFIQNNAVFPLDWNWCLELLPGGSKHLHKSRKFEWLWHNSEMCILLRYISNSFQNTFSCWRIVLFCRVTKQWLCWQMVDLKKKGLFYHRHRTPKPFTMASHSPIHMHSLHPLDTFHCLYWSSTRYNSKLSPSNRFSEPVNIKN